MIRQKSSGGTPVPPPAPSWMTGAMIGMTILSLAGSAMALGAGMALSSQTVRGK